MNTVDNVLPAYIIDNIRRRERAQREREDNARRLPLYAPEFYDPPPGNDHAETGYDWSIV